MKNKNHLTIEGLHQIIKIKAFMNLGLSDIIKSNFKNLNIIPVERPVINNTNIPDLQWLAGFVCGESCFHIKITNSKTNIGKRVELNFSIAQHKRDMKLLELIIKYLGFGKIYKQSKRNVIEIRVSKFLEIKNIIIPFFLKDLFMVQNKKTILIDVQ
jgi:LAGLIDADG endonuclease